MKIEGNLTYSRSIEELQKHAVTWWPSAISSIQTEGSIIPKLLQTRGKFISLLKLSGSHPFAIFSLAVQAGFPGNLLVKHLAVLTDLGGEGLKRIETDFSNLFAVDPNSGRHFMEFLHNEMTHRYEFGALPLKSGKLDNSRLGIDGSGINSEQNLSELHKDVIALLLYGSANIEEQISSKSDFYKCIVGSILGNEFEIDKYVSERYIWVSRITGGATANDLGQIAQTWVAELIRNGLDDTFEVTKNGTISIDGERVTSDVLITRNKISVGVEVSFQVTTNSTIERKGNEAENRKRLMHSEGHFVAYVIDGAGNFERKSAVSKICNMSDCTVAFSEQEIGVLCSFIRERLC